MAEDMVLSDPMGKDYYYISVGNWRKFVRSPAGDLTRKAGSHGPRITITFVVKDGCH